MADNINQSLIKTINADGEEEIHSTLVTPMGRVYDEVGIRAILYILKYGKFFTRVYPTITKHEVSIGRTAISQRKYRVGITEKTYFKK